MALLAQGGHIKKQSGEIASQVNFMRLQFDAMTKQSNLMERQLEEMKRQNENSKTALQATQRAFFTFIRYQTITMFEKADNQGKWLGLRFGIEYENVGRTPAIDAEMLLGFMKVKKGESEDFMLVSWEDRGGPRIPSTVAPGAKVYGLLELDETECEMIASGELSVFIYTQARYRDVFPNTPVHRHGTCVKLIKIADFMSGSPFQFKLFSNKYNYGD